MGPFDVGRGRTDLLFVFWFDVAESVNSSKAGSFRYEFAGGSCGPAGILCLTNRPPADQSNHSHAKSLKLAMTTTLCLLVASFCTIAADGPADNQPERVRPIPPPGIELSDADRTELQSKLMELGNAIDALRESLKLKPALLDLIPDVQIYHNAVRYAVQYNEFFDVKELPIAKSLI